MDFTTAEVYANSGFMMTRSEWGPYRAFTGVGLNGDGFTFLQKDHGQWSDFDPLPEDEAATNWVIQ